MISLVPQQAVDVAEVTVDNDVVLGATLTEPGPERRLQSIPLGLVDDCVLGESKYGFKIPVALGLVGKKTFYYRILTSSSLWSTHRLMSSRMSQLGSSLMNVPELLLLLVWVILRVTPAEFTKHASRMVSQPSSVSSRWIRNQLGRKQCTNTLILFWCFFSPVRSRSLVCASYCRVGSLWSRSKSYQF